jgi:hypothetical protein
MSLMDQKSPSPITIVTSTPSSHIQTIADRYGIRYIPHHNESSIGGDWNMALASCTSKWVTLAHQDDLYDPEYSSEIKKAIDECPNATLMFTDYAELIDGTIVKNSTLILLKRMLLNIGFLGRETVLSTRAKLNSLRFGCTIPCPAVTLKRNPEFQFNESMRVNLDWDAWIRLAKAQGAFVRVKKPLMTHRIHTSQETQRAKQSGVRQNEDLAVLKTLWPSPIAQLISKTYRLLL